MAPEIITGEKYNQMVDVWSLGITAMELVTGKVPHSTLRPQLAMAASLQQPEPRLGAAYSTAAREFVEQCLQKEPEKRQPLEGLLKMKFLREVENQCCSSLLSYIMPEPLAILACSCMSVCNVMVSANISGGRPF